MIEVFVFVTFLFCSLFGSIVVVVFVVANDIIFAVLGEGGVRVIVIVVVVVD